VHHHQRLSGARARRRKVCFDQDYAGGQEMPNARFCATHGTRSGTARQRCDLFGQLVLTATPHVIDRLMRAEPNRGAYIRRVSSALERPDELAEEAIERTGATATWRMAGRVGPLAGTSRKPRPWGGGLVGLFSGEAHTSGDFL